MHDLFLFTLSLSPSLLSVSHPTSWLLFLSLLILESNVEFFIALDLAVSCFAETVSKASCVYKGIKINVALSGSQL